MIEKGKPAKDGYTKNFWGETIELKSFSINSKNFRISFKRLLIFFC